MGISTKQLHAEKTSLQKSFDELNVKIQTIDKEVQIMRNNLNAIHGALQQVNKMIEVDARYNKQPEKDSSLEIKEKEQAKLLNEGEKWKKISTIF